MKCVVNSKQNRKIYKMKKTFVIAAGLFLGNWIAVPLILARPFSFGFYVGFVAAILVLFVSLLIDLVQRLCLYCVRWMSKSSNQTLTLRPTSESSQTLEQFLLSKYQYCGELLGNSSLKRTIPGSIGAMTDPLDRQFEELVRFKFRNSRPPLEKVREILFQYYKSIGWRIEMEEPDRGTISGYVYPVEVETCLVLVVTYENDDPNILVIAICAMIG